MIHFIDLFPELLAPAMWIFVLGVSTMRHYPRMGEYIAWFGIIYMVVVTIITLISGCIP
jgi:hypothetical protein